MAKALGMVHSVERDYFESDGGQSAGIFVFDQMAAPVPKIKEGPLYVKVLISSDIYINSCRD
jgi:hypothetical protein